ncbi:MAG TPA: efflux RND transporter permease subunit [Vicinamibacterales bacterium]|jgi:multidrug efflux pump subunit AcrB|nr:efflux RND transporter permease subunit [Vicinamibacterales bacterium]
MTSRLGVAGRLAATFIPSKLTPLLIVGSIALGAFAVAALPREEEPQIIVPMVDVFVELPGASPTEVEQRITRPMEKLLWEVPGVEYIYSISSPGQSLAVVRFLVGEDQERALVRLDQKLAANADRIPPGASGPLVKPRSIDDVPIMAVTLWGEGYDDHQLRSLAAQLREALAEVPEVSEVTLIGGRPREIGVQLDPARLAAAALDPVEVMRALEGANARSTVAGPVARGNVARLETGQQIESVAALRDVIVSAQGDRSIRLGDIALAVDGDAPPSAYVRFHTRDTGTHPAVTIAMAKRKGANAITVAHQIEDKLATVRPSLLPGDLQVTVTRDYGETAADKSNELLYHMFLAVLSVSALIALALGVREAIVVLVAIPVTLALTLFAFFVYGYTLNRITLFALIFSIGILVDDAIVVVENIVRHARLRTEGEAGLTAIAVRAVDEVGNPTILATLTVVAAILPMAFVGGLMGPYMRPIPVGASAAMMFSLAAAFIVTPWAAARLLRAEGTHDHAPEGAATRLYRRLMATLVTNGRIRLLFLGGVAVLLLAAMTLVPLKLVTVKMLPFDNKSEFQVIVDMPEGTALEQTARVSAELAQEVLKDASVVNVQSYVGVSSPYNFNGLVRHYFLRRAPHLADLQVNLRPKDDRDEQSHAIAKRVRERLVPIGRRFNATVQVSEVPPGPPVLQTLVAEVYGPDPARRLELAGQVKSVLESTAGVVDVDWYVASPQPKTALVVDESRASAAGLSAAHVATAVRLATDGGHAGLFHDPYAREDVPIVVRLPRTLQGSTAAVRELRLGPNRVAIGELTREEARMEADSLYHKNLLPVTYVTGDLAGAAESPVYAILRMNEIISTVPMPEGYAFEIYNTRQPFDTTKYAMKWDGEWHITYEVFRDLGIAFAAVLVLIYILVVWWFEAFGVPLTIMAAIPFSLIGILPAHAAMGAFFTATSMIGFIAGAGIVVRNSIILVDFIELRVREGMPLAEAVVDAGAVRFRPMALTAAAVIVGSAVILFDPIFQGLAISLMAGEVASLLLSRVTVPVLYFMSHQRRQRPVLTQSFQRSSS